MKSFSAAVAALAFLAAPAAAQTWTSCNPLSRSDCPADPALGKTVSIDFKNGAAADHFVPFGNPSYDKSNGVSFTVAKSGDSPQLTSKWYIMFGKVSVTMKAAPGAGIVSSFVLQSDDLDEIDWEWLGATPNEVQSNYFSKGDTSVYNRGAFHADPNSQTQFKTYTVEWTSTQVVWQIDGVTVRVLRAQDVGNNYPQTPMQVKVGAWSGGDPANAPGTIEWAKGPTDYSKGPFSMQVQNLVVADYSTGTEYKYGDQSGKWQSIIAVGGKVNPGSGAVEQAPPIVTSSATGQQPIPFTSTITRPSVYPWIPDSSTHTTASVITSYPGLPSGWTVTSSGRVVPPSSAPSTSPTGSPSSSPSQSQQGSPSGGNSEATAPVNGGGSPTTLATQSSSTAATTNPAAAPNAPNGAGRTMATSGVLITVALIGSLLL